MAELAPKLSEEDLRQWKLVAELRKRLEALAEGRRGHPSWEDRRRRLEQLDYLSLFLLALVNPVLKSLRAVSAASQLKRVQEEICTRSVSLGSFSEAQHLVEVQLLEELIGSLSEEVSGPPPKDPRQAWQVWVARDSSIFKATSRMFWAQYGAGKAGCPNHGVRLHVSFHLWEDKPSRVAVTPGKVCERKMWREQLEAGALYVGDRNFGQDYQMFERLQAAGCSFVLRLRDEAVMQVEESLPVGAQEQQAGILSDAWVRLGSCKRYRTGPWRVVCLRKPSGTLMRLVTNLSPEQMSSREIQTLYRRRWQIECFFRWIKCLLGCRHWLAQSQNGVTIQLYLAVIAGLMLQLVLGRRPHRRLWERMQLYLMGWASLDELMQAVHKALEKTVSKKR